MKENIAEARLIFDNFTEIQKACDIAEKAVSCGKEIFLQEGLFQNAAAMALIRVGQASSNLWKHAPNFKEMHPKWPWNEIRNVRNALTHEYAIMIPNNVWEAVTILLKNLLDEEINPELIRLAKKYPQFMEEKAAEERKRAFQEIFGKH